MAQTAPEVLNKRPGNSVEIMTEGKATNDVTTILRALTYTGANTKNHQDSLAITLLSPTFKLIASCACIGAVVLGIFNKKFPGIKHYFNARTLWLDELTYRCISKGFKQVVILGAGLDTRAYRMKFDQSDVTFFEVDKPAVISNKRDLIKTAKLHEAIYVSCDFTKTDLRECLFEKGFNSAENTLFILEGLTYYLPQDVLDKLIEEIGSIGKSGDYIAMDYLIRNAFENPDKYQGLQDMMSTVAKKDEPWLSSLPLDTAEKYFGPASWRVEKTMTHEAISSTFLAHISTPDSDVLSYFIYLEASHL